MELGLAGHSALLPVSLLLGRPRLERRKRRRGLMLSLFLSAFVTFFVVIDPPGCAPIFAGLTRGGSSAHRRSMALRSTGIATIILILFALVGEPLLTTLGI